MSSREEEDKIPDSVRDLNDTAVGLHDPDYSYDYIYEVADDTARRFKLLMREAQTGQERAELMATFSTHLMKIADQPFDRNASIESLNTTAAIVKRMGDALVFEADGNTVPDYFTPDQLRYLAGHLRTAGDAHDQMTNFVRGISNVTAVKGLAMTYLNMADSIENLADVYTPDEPAPPSRESAAEARAARRNSKGGTPRFF